MNIAKGKVTDSVLEKMMKDKNANEILKVSGVKEQQIRTEIELDKANREFLSDIIRYELSGVVERYDRLKLSPYKGNKIKANDKWAFGIVI